MPTDADGSGRVGTTDRTRMSAGEYEHLLAALRRFIRTEGEAYLADPNITSIGIGYKITEGRQTPEISVQFTVDKKVAEPASLDALGTAAVPESIVIDGVAVPTDVLERRYAPAFRLVAEPPTVSARSGSTRSCRGPAWVTVHHGRHDRRRRLRPAGRHAVRAEQLARAAGAGRRDRRRRGAARAARRQPPRRQPAGPAGPLAPGNRGATAPSRRSRAVASTPCSWDSAWSRRGWQNRSWATPSSSPAAPPG